MDPDKLIDSMMEKLNDGEESMKKQVDVVCEIVEKSNNILLQIEATRCQKPPSTMSNNVDVFTYNKDNIHAFAAIVGSYPSIEAAKTSLNKDNCRQPNISDFELFLRSTSQKIESLGGGARKLLAINDTVSQMKTNLEINEESEIE